MSGGQRCRALAGAVDLLDELVFEVHHAAPHELSGQQPVVLADALHVLAGGVVAQLRQLGEGEDRHVPGLTDGLGLRVDALLQPLVELAQLAGRGGDDAKP